MPRNPVCPPPRGSGMTVLSGMAPLPSLSAASAASVDSMHFSMGSRSATWEAAKISVLVSALPSSLNIVSSSSPEQLAWLRYLIGWHRNAGKYMG